MSITKVARFFNLQKDRRYHPRIYDRPIKLIVNGFEYLTDNWSMTGFQISNFQDDLEQGAQVVGQHLESQSAITKFVAEVVWRTSDDSVGLRFVELNGMQVV